MQGVHLFVHQTGISLRFTIPKPFPQNFQVLKTLSSFTEWLNTSVESMIQSQNTVEIIQSQKSTPCELDVKVLVEN